MNSIQTNKNIIVTNKAIQIIIKDGIRPYFISWNRLKSERQLIEWISHLSKKNWFTQEILNDFILIVNEHNKFNLVVE